ncbi:hypothetical protein VCHC55B2_3679B, partial [Vibrio cholerae HC-55B2]
EDLLRDFFWQAMVTKQPDISSSSSNSRMAVISLLFS